MSADVIDTTRTTIFLQGNVLVNSQHRALLADFGLSRALDVGPTGFTTGNDARGTVRYSSPEVLLHGTAGQSLSDDIWSWGCLVLEALTDKMPFADIQAEPQLILAVVQGRSPSDVNNLSLHVPRLKDLLVTCWRPQPNQRPTAVDCLRAIEQSLPKLDTDSLAPQRDDIPFQTPQPLGAPEDYNVILERASPTSFQALSSASGITGADNSLGLYTIDPVPGTSRDGSRRNVTGPYFLSISPTPISPTIPDPTVRLSLLSVQRPQTNLPVTASHYKTGDWPIFLPVEPEWDEDGQWYKVCQATIVAAAGLGGSQTTLKHDLPHQSVPELSSAPSVLSASIEPVMQNVNVTHGTGSTSTIATKAARSPALRQGKDDPVGATTVTFDPIAKLQERSSYMSGAAWRRELLMNIATPPSMGGTGHNKRKSGDVTAPERLGRPVPDIKRARGSPTVTKTGATSPAQPTRRSLRKRETSTRTQQTG
ncbi:hypothetical protein FRC05_007853 [Tulasnella sp. 425]|nr:hypothetical protein FRC05_007853 [Tulasnella sp. 425]